MSLQRITDDLLAVEHDLWLPGGVLFRGRMCVVRLGDGTVWLHSPVPVDDALAAEIDALGPVSAIVAPNLLHHLHAPAAAARWPDARVYAAPGLRDKLGDGLRIDADLEHATSPWPELDVAVLRGAPGVNECVFLHRPSRTLLVTDLVFNVHHRCNAPTALVLTVVGGRGQPAMSRSWRWIFVKDRAAFAASLATVLAWPFDRLVPAHGEVIDTAAHAVLAGLLPAWAGRPAQS